MTKRCLTIHVGQLKDSNFLLLNLFNACENENVSEPQMGIKPDLQ